jgi:hypothetical protein
MRDASPAGSTLAWPGSPPRQVKPINESEDERTYQKMGDTDREKTQRTTRPDRPCVNRRVKPMGRYPFP